MSVLATVALILTIAAELPSAITATSEWITLKNVAWNAAVKQRGEADVAAATARRELEIARNAKERQKAESDLAVAAADKQEAEARIERAKADNARKKTKADADRIVAEASVNQNKAITELQKARVAAIQKRTEADTAEISLKNDRFTLRQMVYMAYMINCPGNTYIAKIESAEAGRCSLPRYR